MSDPGEAIGYAHAAPTYWDKGWRGILPTKRGHKAGREARLPTGFTGHNGVDPSYPDILAWSEDEFYKDGNLCLRLPADTGKGFGVIGIDVDAYGAKTGAAALEEAEKRWGRLPAAPKSTSRAEDDPISGIRLFKVPANMAFVTKLAFTELGIGDIEIIQHHHRYVVCWPSIHPEGRQYWWHNENNQLIGIPDVEELPWLPQEWIDGLKTAPTAALALDTGEHVDVRKCMTDGEPSPRVQARLGQAIKELNLPGQSRHDTCCRHVLALLRLGKPTLRPGEPGVKRALELLCDVFVAVTGIDASRTPDEARNEFIRMITNANAARELSKPGLTDWVRNLIVDDVGSTPPPPSSEEEPGRGVKPSPVQRPDQATDDYQSRLEELEQGFWDRRESLKIIYTASLARMVAPWSVMAFCAARALTQVRPHWVLPPVIGSAGSLNWFAAIVDRSSGGKTVSKMLARELVSGDVRERNLGSGEGIVGQFYKPPAKIGEIAEIHEANMFNADEVDVVGSLGSRNGSTTMSVLRSAFSGDTLGFSYIAKGRDVHLEAHTYRMTLVIAVQPGRAGVLLDDHLGGTPQRFMWFPANDDRVTPKAHSEWIPGPIDLPDLELYPRVLSIPDEARDLIIETRAKNARREIDALDGHALFCREKFAYSLALLDGRTDMNSEDWELSGIAADISTYTRERMAAELKAAREAEAEEKGRLLGISGSMSDEEKVIRAGERVQRIIRWALRRLEETGPLTPREMTQAAPSRDRPWLATALGELQSAGLIGHDGEGRWIRL